MPSTPARKLCRKNVGARFIAPAFELVVAQHAARFL